jgi:hypothetical protein
MRSGGVGPSEERVDVRSYFESLAGELHSLTGAVNDIYHTLGGSLVSRSFIVFIVSHHFSSLPISLPFALPPVRPLAQNQDPPEAARSTSPSALALPDLQSQLHETQTSLASHVERTQWRHKWEVGLLRQLVEKTTNNDVCNREEEEFRAEDNDARSIRTGAESGAW